MAGDWLKFEKSTSDKPEVWAMADQLEVDPDAVVGKLLRVWAWFDEQSEKGNAPAVTKMLLDRRVGVTGFCDAMVSCGWMIENGNEVKLPNFDRHNGKTAKERSLTAKRQQKHREKSNAESNGSGVTSALPREEKRREESNDKEHVPPKGGTSDYSPEFEQAWKAYPKRHTSSNKKATYKQWKARLNNGFTAEDMTQGIDRYAKFCKAEGQLGTKFVKMPETFLGPNEHFMEEWTVTESGGYDPMARDTSRDAENLEFQKELLRMTRQ